MCVYAYIHLFGVVLLGRQGNYWGTLVGPEYKHDTYLGASGSCGHGGSLLNKDVIRCRFQARPAQGFLALAHTFEKSLHILGGTLRKFSCFGTYSSITCTWDVQVNVWTRARFWGFGGLVLQRSNSPNSKKRVMSGSI